MKVAFVVLHYLTIQETLDCVKSIIDNIDPSEYEIVIVDNGSNDPEQTQKLSHLKRENVHLITIEKNVGFARGHNTGIRFARDVLHADLIVALSNDTLVKQSDFCKVLIQKYVQYGFSILGPRILSSNGKYNCNPLPEKNYSVGRTVCLQFILLCMYVLSYIDADLPLDRLLGLTQAKSANKVVVQDNCDVIGARLHGSCVVFSPLFLNCYEGFSPETYLYMEEDLLYLRIKKANLISLYTPDLEIIHLEDATINMLLGKGRNKRRYVYKNHLRSASVLVKEMLKNDHKLSDINREL